MEQTRGLDFGAGFYLTTSETQAVRFSEIVTSRRKSGIATVNVYEFDMESAESTLSFHRFKSADKEWLRFVTANRLNTYKGDAFDMIIGAVANDIVMPTVQGFYSGFISEEVAINTLMTSKLVDQVCLKSDKALSMLCFISSYTIKRGSENG
jgi:hypothetical protein